MTVSRGMSDASATDIPSPATCQPAGHPSAPAELLMVIERSVRGMDQKLGYPGHERFVFFYYEPRGEEVVWRDASSYAFATGAWEMFMDEVAPLAKLYGVDLGSNSQPVKHVLLIDRGSVKAYFVPRDDGIEFLNRIAAGEQIEPPDALAAIVPTSLTAMSVEITQETIAQVAYDIWQKKGRPEGQTLQDWLDAEAQLRARGARAQALNPPEMGH